MIEPLENRIAPSLTVFSIHGHLNITGTPNGVVTVTELSDGKVQVQDGNGTFTPLGNINSLIVRLHGAPPTDDVLNLNLTQGLIRHANIDLGGGENTTRFVSGGAQVAALVRGAAGSDTVEVLAGAALRSLEFNAGQGNNVLQIAGAIEGKAIFVTFEGADTLTLAPSGSIGKLSTRLGVGVDTITLSGAVRVSAQLGTDSDADVITINSSAVLGSLSINASTGNNVISIAGRTATTSISVADGNDQISFLPTFFAHNVRAVLGAGTNTVNFSGEVSTSAQILGGAHADTVVLGNGLSVGLGATLSLGAGSNVVDSQAATSSTLGSFGRLTIRATGGDDSVRLSGFQVTGAVSVGLGAGTNSFTIPARFSGGEIASLIAKSLSYTGGGGIDTVLVESSESLIGPGAGTFKLGGGNDTMHIIGSKPVFTTSLTVSGGGGEDAFSKESLFANIRHRFSSIENLS